MIDLKWRDSSTKSAAWIPLSKTLVSTLYLPQTLYILVISYYLSFIIVFLTDHVATEDFKVRILGKDHTFPAGTVILIPFALAMTDKYIWGENAHDVDHNRPNLIENSMIFNSVGNKTNNRICPGKSLTMNMAIEMIIECGKVRKRHMFHVVK